MTQTMLFCICVADEEDELMCLLKMMMIMRMMITKMMMMTVKNKTIFTHLLKESVHGGGVPEVQPAPSPW